MTLEQALHDIQVFHSKQKVVMIEIEDGSGSRFNYRLSGEKNVRFIDFEKHKFVKSYVSLQKILNKF